MGYRNLKACVDELAAIGQLVRIEQEVDPDLEAAEIHRRVNQAGGPAIYYARVKDCRFPMVSNLFGTMTRARFLFRDALDGVKQLVQWKADPSAVLRHPLAALTTTRTLWSMLPHRVRRAPVLANQTTISQLPAVRCWPRDGGPFITLPQVYTEDVEHPGWRRSNLGMYRVQMSGNHYARDREVGLHYQIHRGIGVHHAAAMRRNEPLRVQIFVGGPPSMTLAAVMPLPEGMSELAFAGALGRRRVPLVRHEGELPIHAEADFCITGTVDPTRNLPEGPFGDHLGYYSLAHDYPVLKVERVWHRDGAIWPFTVVGRPPQEDTVFGEIIHELTGPAMPAVIPGLHAVHAVDAAGVHPLLLAIGSERYTPYAERRQPQELLTIASAILGQGQLSLAKYLFIAAREDAPALKVDDVGVFLRHILERVDWQRDLHFQTCTTIDTLDYSGTGLNEGSKVVIAAAGPARRTLAGQGGSLPEFSLPSGFRGAVTCLPGVLVVEGPPVQQSRRGDDPDMQRLCDAYRATDPINQFPLIVVVDDSKFAARSLSDFLWVTFTRSNPAADMYGIEPFVEQKHWGCRGAVIIDARIKPHHAPPLEPDPEIARRVDALGAPGGPLHKII